MSKEKAKIVDSISPDFKSFYATGVFGGLSPDDGKLIFYLNRLTPESNPDTGEMIAKKVSQELQVELHCSPLVFKIIAQWMQKHVEQFEKKFGVIRQVEPIPEKKADQAVRPAK